MVKGHDIIEDQTPEAIVDMLRAFRMAAEEVARAMESLRPVWRQLMRGGHKAMAPLLRLGSRDAKPLALQLDIRLADVAVRTDVASTVYQHEDAAYFVRHRVDLPP